MIGRRFPDGDFVDEEGGYAKMAIAEPDGTTTIAWLVRPPGARRPCIIGRPNANGTACHWVRENEDGTITVEPEPSDAPVERRNSNSILFGGWHGYIYDGEWRPC